MLRPWSIRTAYSRNAVADRQSHAAARRAGLCFVLGSTLCRIWSPIFLM